MYRRKNIKPAIAACCAEIMAVTYDKEQRSVQVVVPWKRNESIDSAKD
jgi:hypothetical protein